VTGLCRPASPLDRALVRRASRKRAIQIHPPSIRTPSTSVKTAKPSLHPSRCRRTTSSPIVLTLVAIRHSMVSLHVINASRFRDLPGRNKNFRPGDLRLCRSACPGMPPSFLKYLNSHPKSWDPPGLQDRTVAYPRSSKFSVHDNSRRALDLTE
jgi:hypothetical protein